MTILALMQLKVREFLYTVRPDTLRVAPEWLLPTASTTQPGSLIRPRGGIGGRMSGLLSAQSTS